MRLLACDLGGTNIRFGLGDAGELDRASVHSFANDRFSGFGEALAHYLALTGGVALDGAVVALAAPADGDTVRLTNRDWTISARDIATVARTGRVVLVNDFAALGAALSRPASLDCEEVLPGSRGDGVRLVLGAGTVTNWVSGAMVMKLGAVAMMPTLPAARASRPMPPPATVVGELSEPGAMGSAMTLPVSPLVTSSATSGSVTETSVVRPGPPTRTFCG